MLSQCHAVGPCCVVSLSAFFMNDTLEIGKAGRRGLNAGGRAGGREGLCS